MPRNEDPREGEDRLLDLPLGGGQDEGAEPPLTPRRAGGAAAPRAVTPGWRPRLGWRAALVLAAAAAVAYLLLRPAAPRFEPSREALEFGSARVGEGEVESDVVVRNGGERPLDVRRAGIEGEDAGDFTQVGENCVGERLEPGAACTLRVRFAPRQTGARRALLRMEGEAANSPLDLPLSGEGVAPQAVFEPRGLEFARAPVGRSGVTALVRLRNAGTAPLRVAEPVLEGAAAADFAVTADGCSGTLLDPGAGCSLRLVFSPRAAGARRARLALRSDSLPPPPAIELSGDGALDGPVLLAEPAALTLGRHVVGGPRATATLTLRNQGEVALDLGELRIVGARSFALAENGCSGAGSLDAGEACRVTVAFTPAAEGEARGVLEVGSSAGGTRMEVPLTGVGVAPRVALSAVELSFGEALPGGPGASRALRLESRGSGPLAVARTAFDGSDAGAFAMGRDGCAGRTLEPGAQCEMEVLFRPRREGAHEGRLRLSLGPPLGDQTVPLRGLGAAPRLVVAAERLEFGGARLTTSEERQLVLRNDGLAAAEVGEVRIEADPAGEFDVASNACSERPVPPGASCVVSVRFTPREIGERTATLRIGGTGERRDVPLLGRGLPPPVPLIRVAPSRAEFGAQPLGQRSSPVTVTVANPGTGPLVLRDVTLVGAAAGDFRIVPGTCQGPPSIAPAGECTIGVRFVPAAAGERRAALRIRHSAAGGEVSVELYGEGLVSRLQ